MGSYKQWGRTLGLAGLMVVTSIPLSPPAVLAALASAPAAERWAPFRSPLQRYSVARPAYPEPGVVVGPRPVSWRPPLAAAALASSVFPPLEAPRFSLRGTLGLGLGLGLNMGTFLVGTLSTQLVPGMNSLALAPLTFPVHMAGFGIGYGVAGDWGRGFAVGLFGAGLVTLAPLVGYAAGTLVPRVPDPPGLFADTEPHHGRPYGTNAFMVAHALMTAYTAWDTYLTALRVEREAEAQPYGLRPPLAPGQEAPPAHP
ncbi:MAG: hypothetical protein VKP62_04545 [Candidatus Sericytochromatia bacterium]|nr:hypothetical protein [Candidatus Sericytochromatia bacterium]